jgi:lipoate-protein ligase A
VTTVRLIDAGAVPWLRSQALYHGLAYARTLATPDTVVLCTPAEPYVCLGYHQDLEREIDLAYCREAGLPVLRRETGGGAVYLDRHQLFVQWVFAPDSLPPRVESKFELFCGPLVATYRELGVAAAFRPINDVHAGGKKISGTGAAHIGEAEVLIGNFLLDFDTEIMARVVRAPSAAFRDQVGKSLARYMTSLRQELGAMPAPADVAARYARACAAALRAELVPGELTAEERRAVEEQELRLSDPEFLSLPGGLRRPGVKIHEDVWVAERGLGDVTLTARLREGRIEEVALQAPQGRLSGLEEALRGVPLQRAQLLAVLGRYNSGLATAVDVAAWTQALLDLAQPQPIES